MKVTLDIDPIWHERLQRLRFKVKDDPLFRRKPTMENVAHEALLTGIEALESRLGIVSPGEPPGEPEIELDVEDILGYDLPGDDLLNEIYLFAQNVNYVARDLLKSVTPYQRKKGLVFIVDVAEHMPPPFDKYPLELFKAFLVAAYQRGLVILQTIGYYPTEQKWYVRKSSTPTKHALMHLIKVTG